MPALAQPPAVILGGSVNAVSVARSLGSRGIEVRAVGDRSDRPVSHSRHCREYVAFGDRAGVQAGWLDWLERRGPRGAVVLPCDDDGLELIARNRARLIELGYRPFEADDDVVLAMLDKDRTNELARAAGVATPESIAIRTRADLYGALDRLAYPCSLKPLHSHLFQRHFGTLKALDARNRHELEATMTKLIELNLEMMATEFIPGPEQSYFGYYSYIDEHGEPLFHLTKQKLRQFPPRFGMGCYHVTNWDPEIADIGLRFLKGVGVRGLANVEFKRDERDGRPRLIECNHRFTAINELLRIAGADLALFSYARLLGRPPPAVDGYRRGVRFLYPMQDARTCIALRRRGELSVRDWGSSLLHRQHFPLLSREDPRPSIVAPIARVQRLLARVRPRPARAIIE